MRKFLTGILCLAFMLTVMPTISAPAANKISVLIDGQPVAFETPPQVINDRVMVQIRAIAERLGCSVKWDDNTQTSYINQPNVPLQKLASMGSNINVYVNNRPIDFPDQKPIMYEGYVLMPSRGVVEALGYTVSWDDSSQTQSISTKGNASVKEQGITTPTYPAITSTPAHSTITAAPAKNPPQAVSASYVGNKKSMVFHLPNCESVAKMKDSSKIYYDTRSEAVNAGYKPCQNCNP